MLGPRGDPGTGISLAGTSGVLWGTLGLVAEGAHWLEAALARVEPQTPESDQAQLWLRLGRLVEETPSRARPALERAAELYRQLGDAAGLANALVRLGRVLAFMGRFQQSETVLAEAHSLMERAGSPPGLLTQYFFNMAYLKNHSGDFAGARRLYEQSLAMFRQFGDEYGEISTLGNLANVAWALGDLDAAEAGFRHQLSVVRESPMKSNHILGWALACLAGVLTERRKLDEAFAASREGLPLLAENGNAWIFLLNDALRNALAGQFSNAARLAGYSDYTFAAKEATRAALDARTREPLHALLRQNLAPAELERLLAEGAKMSDDEASRLALED
jgi:tetratricopeptide (TPR) repeat protein